MEQQLWSNDNELLDALRDALRSAGPVPENVTTSGRAAWTWRTIDAELATLVFDSYLQETASVRLPGASGTAVPPLSKSLLSRSELTCTSSGRRW